MQTKIQSPAELVKKHGIKPDKKLGQNFITRISVMEKIANALEISKQDFVIEFGSGPGSLAAIIAAKGANVVAIEKDKRMLKIARSEFPEIDFIEADMRKWEPSKTKRRFKIVGNLPYYLTSHFIRRCFEWSFECAVFMIQKEVGDKIAAKPGSKDYGLLSVLIQGRANVEKIFKIGKGAFLPQPKVESIVIKLIPKKEPWPKGADEIAELLFSHRRQMVSKSLKKKYSKDKVEQVLESLEISEKARPEELGFELFKELSIHLNS